MSPNDPRKQLAALMDACAENAESMTDEEVLEDATATGIDPGAESTRVRGLLLGAFVKAKNVQLSDAARAHQKSAPWPADRRSRIPTAASERRALLMQELERRPQMKSAVSELQHRDSPSFSDSEVENVLNQLEALGLLGDGTPKPGS